MLSYRHSFHAGNHADLLKHFVLVQLLRYFNQKDKPYWYIDTHAGAGCYQLDSVHAKKNAEFETGITRLWPNNDQQCNLSPEIADYVKQVRTFNSNNKLRLYPGSPLIALQLMRPDDRLRLFELHSTDYRLLCGNFKEAGRRAAITHGDGFAEIKSVLPPPPRRGLMLIDPSYEDKRDYLRVVATMKEALSRFPGGTYAIWYPLLQRGDARQLPEKLKKLAPDWLNVSLMVRAPQADGFGMHGSGLFIVNPPWTLKKILQSTMPLLTKALAQDDSAAFKLETS
ncbi:Ribosomal RNA large subunit methyltransferase J [Georgfuchsia toluolica]|uniref:Ribosomal RNA large subunit methyltransferase J n=1 Tax=Georgfuchsia toluolica TaxID=424218 RepID=A0A916JAH3_9PROT|nr:23S rRNA (adenine(2030)-N(6))-methyltransferase RlmJ [Georgfuchsia toluolica]CAG4885338.1 Ribosomal RNA large subunit methyltransferase J [Georgfuchsia toluolica]